MAISKLRERLGRIVAVVFDGNTNAAAQAAGVEQSTLHRILEGKVADPRLGTVQELADAFGVPMGWMLGELSNEQAEDAHRPDGYGSAIPLPHAYWLIYCFHRTKQARLRTWLRNASGRNTEARRILSDFSNFEFAPIHEGFAFPAIRNVMAAYDSPTPSEVGVMRKCAELESALLELAVEMAKRAGAEAGKPK